MGRKKIELNWDKLDSYLQFKASRKVCAHLLEVSEETIERRIREKYDKNFSIREIPLDDPKTYDLFGNGNTIGIFQFESSGMQEYLRKLKPNRVEDLIAMNALYRPGPMEMIDDYIDRKKGRKDITYLHPKLEPILNETYGIIVYQEQVMRITSELGGFTLVNYVLTSGSQNTAETVSGPSARIMSSMARAEASVAPAPS